MKSFKNSRFQKEYDDLPVEIQRLADKQYDLWKENPYHPSLHFKCVNKQKNLWSVRINRDFRALGIRKDDAIVWFWIGDHDRYEKLI